MVQSICLERADQRRLAAIVAEVDGRRPLTLAAGYPRSWLRALARDLIGRIKDSAGDPLFDPPPPKIGIVDGPVEPSGFRERPDRPDRSDVAIERRPDGVAFIVPPRGVGRGVDGCGLIVVALMFLTGALMCLLAATGIMTGRGNTWVAL